MYVNPHIAYQGSPVDAEAMNMDIIARFQISAGRLALSKGNKL
jgi:hypothetical protein